MQSLAARSTGAGARLCATMSDTIRFKMLRAKYRSLWDAHQIIADHNARLAKSGQQPSNEQLINEQRAAEAVALAREELLAAVSRLAE
jgi:hypothetical protein